MRPKTKSLQGLIANGQYTIDPTMEKNSKDRTPHRSTGDKRSTKISPTRDPYTTWKNLGRDMRTPEELSEQLRHRVKVDEEMITIDEFLNDENIDDRRWREFKAQHPVLQDACEYAMRVIAVRREKRIMDFKCPPAAGMFILPQYSKTWRNEVDHRATIAKKDAHDQVGAIKVWVEQIPDQKSVPELPGKDTGSNQGTDTLERTVQNTLVLVEDSDNGEI